MDWGDWKTIGTALAAIAAVLTGLVKFVPAVRMVWVKWRARMKQTTANIDARVQLQISLADMRRRSSIESLMRQWLPNKSAQRGLLLTASNGGEAAWKAGSHLTVSNTAQVVGPGEPNTMDMWWKFEADAWYRNFLWTLLETFERKRGMLLVTENNVEGELLKQYRAQGTVASVVLPFKWMPGGVLWYVSLNFGRYPKIPGSDEPHPLTSEEIPRYVSLARDIYTNAPRCRQLIQSLEAAHNSVI